MFCSSQGSFVELGEGGRNAFLSGCGLKRRRRELMRFGASDVSAAQAEFMPKGFIMGTGSYKSGSRNLTAIPSVGQQAATFNLNGGQLSGTIPSRA